MKAYLTLITLLILTAQTTIAQNITTDTTLANRYFAIADSLQTTRNYDSSMVNFTKAEKFYLLAEKWQKYLRCEGKNARNLRKKRKYEEALQKADSVVVLSIEKLGNNNTEQAYALWVTGNVYAFGKGKYDIGLKYLQKALLIQESILPHHHVDLLWSYNNIAVVYSRKSEYNKAIEYFFKVLAIRKELLGEKHIDVAWTYNDIGIVYWSNSEYDKALECYFKSLEIYKELLGEKHTYVAMSYNNIGLVYWNKSEYDKALEYYFKSLEIYKELLGKKHSLVARSYMNIGSVYHNKLEHDKALEYYFESLEIYKELLGEKHTEVAVSYNNIGSVYQNKSEYDKALDYYFKSLAIRKEMLGEKHTDVAVSYNNIGYMYINSLLYDNALVYYQKALCANLSDFNNSSNVTSNPVIQNYIDHEGLLYSLQGKALVFEILANIDSMRITLQGFGTLEELVLQELALQNYQLCDTLINQVRKTITTKSDKIALGEKASTIYSEVMDVCLKLNNKDLAFEYSEKNKAMVLQSSLAHTNALQYTGIPDSLLQKEKTLQTEVALYTQQLAEQPDSIQEVLFRDKLFTANRAYEKLIAQFETDYKEYFAIKHDNKMVTVQEIQNSLDNNTAVLSYFTADSVIYISTISKTTFAIKPVDKPKNFERQVQMFQKSILTKNNKVYSNYGHKLSKTLFPKNTIPKNIKNLVVIPDGILTTIPFEALLSNNVQTLHATSPQNEYSKYPFLIKDYNISYAYSANLWYQKQNKPQKEYDNDFLAFAPVFADGSTAGTTLRTRSMFAEMDSLAFATDSIATRGRMLNGKQITALPATETEVTEIFNLFKKKRKKAIVKTHAQANEEFAKSDTLTNSRIIHIATHGFVNEEKPELSGILLAQDTTQFEDGILYSGEIYNLNLNAELVVLSACETGLGQIKKGEGVMGLTRALMYAGADNLMVSLWKVSDESTSQLMVDFYTKMLKDKKNKKTYSQLLREAKLEMIKGGIYSHPYYWSPFVLIGE